MIADRKVGEKAGFGIFTADYQRLNVVRVDEKPLERVIDIPDNYEELKLVAEKLANTFPEVRVDLYNVNQRIVFGEITFFDGSGYMTFEPDEFDYVFGEKFVINEV